MCVQDQTQNENLHLNTVEIWAQFHRAAKQIFVLSSSMKLGPVIFLLGKYFITQQ